MFATSGRSFVRLKIVWDMLQGRELALSAGDEDYSYMRYMQYPFQKQLSIAFDGSFILSYHHIISSHNFRQYIILPKILGNILYCLKLSSSLSALQCLVRIHWAQLCSLSTYCLPLLAGLSPMNRTSHARFVRPQHLQVYYAYYIYYIFGPNLSSLVCH